MRRFIPLLAILLFADVASAQYGPQPPNQMYYQSVTVARLNPLGLISFSQFTYRRRLFQSNSIFTRDNYIGIGIAPSVSPAFGRLGAMLELQPVPFLRFWAMYELVGYYGTFQFMQSFDSPNAEYSDSTLDDLEETGTNYGLLGSQLTLSGTLQAKVGPAAVRSVLRATRPDYDLRDGDSVFYDAFYDTLVADRGWMLNNDLDVLILPRDQWTIGVRYTWNRSFFRESDYPAGEMDRRGDIVTHRVGPILAYTHFKEYKARFNGPTVLLVLNWWVKHPYRTGEDVHQAIPYVLLGFAFRGDLTAPPRDRSDSDETDD